MNELTVFEEANAESTYTEIESVLSKISTHQWSLGKAYVTLGCLVLSVRQNKYWQDWGYLSFGSFVDYVTEHLDKCRATIYAAVGVAERLLPYVEERQLTDMGISKAQELARFVKQSGRRVTPKLLDMALDNKRKISELHTAVLEELNEKGETKGNWYEFGGFYATTEERKEIEQAVDRFKALNPSDNPEHIQRRDIMLAFAQEFYSSNPIE